MAETIMVYNPKWLQGFLYFAIGAFPCLSGYFFYLGFQAITTSNFVGLFTFSLFGLGVGYLSYIGLLLAKYVSAKVEFNNEQFKVILGKSETVYAWTDIARIKNYESSQILKLFDESGNTIYAVDHMSPGYIEFAEKVNETVSL